MSERHYPAPAPSLPGEDGKAYTDRLLSANHPYGDDKRNRQCSLGYHTECSQRHDIVVSCQCPCHVDFNRVTQEERDCARFASAQKIANLYYLPVETGGRIVHLVRHAVLIDGVDDVDRLREAFVTAYGNQSPTPFLYDVLKVMDDDATAFEKNLKKSTAWRNLLDSAERALSEWKASR